MGKKEKDVVETIGEWSEVKLAVLAEYAKAFTRIFEAPSQMQFRTIYIDAFAGSGLKRRRVTGEVIEGSPLRVLDIQPSFNEHHFIDEDSERIRTLEEQIAVRRSQARHTAIDIEIHEGDALRILSDKLIPSVAYEQYKRALLFLDPYGLDVPFDILCCAAKEGTIDVLLNFSVMDLNRNVLPPKRESLTEVQRDKATRFLGPDWEDEIYQEGAQRSFLGPEYEKLPNDGIMRCYGNRLQRVAGFKYVSEPLLFSHKGANLYYLILASHKTAAKRIMDHIVRKYKKR